MQYRTTVINAHIYLSSYKAMAINDLHMHSILLQKYMSKAVTNYLLKKLTTIKTQKDTELSIFRTFCQNAYSQKCIFRKVYKIKRGIRQVNPLSDTSI